MRIEAYNQAIQTYGVKKVNNVNKPGKTSSMGRDTVQISSIGKDISAIKNAPDIREDRIKEVKKKLDAGEYDDMNKMADLLMKKFGL